MIPMGLAIRVSNKMDFQHHPRLRRLAWETADQSVRRLYQLLPMFAVVWRTRNAQVPQHLQQHGCKALKYVYDL